MHENLVVWYVRLMSKGVKGHQDMERMAKIRERERDERLRRYHDDILGGPGEKAAGDVVLPPIHEQDVVRLCSHHHHYWAASIA